MADDTLKLADQKVLTRAHELLGEPLTLQTEGYVCRTDDLLNVLLGIATNQGTIESVCADLLGTPDPETIRTYFNEQLCVEDLPRLQQCLNAALGRRFPNVSSGVCASWPLVFMTGHIMARRRRPKACGCAARPKRAPRASTG
jgi:hypothetical protein